MRRGNKKWRKSVKDKETAVLVESTQAEVTDEGEKEILRQAELEATLKKSQETYDEITATNKRKRLVSFALLAFTVIVILVIALVEFVGNKGEKPVSINYFLQTLSKNWIYLVYAFALILLFLFAVAVKFAVMLKYTTGKFMWLVSIKLAILGQYYDYITPLNTGGQPYQIYYLSKRVPIGIATGLPITEFFTNQIGFFILAIYAFLTHSYVIESSAMKIWAYIGAGCYLIISTLVLLFSLAPRVMTIAGRIVLNIGVKLRIIKKPDIIREKMNKSIIEYSQSIRTVCRNPLMLIIVLALSLVHYLSLCSIPYFILKACGHNENALDIVCMAVFTYAAISIIPTPGNGGAAEGAFYIIFQSLEAGFMFWGTLLWRISTYYIVLLIGLLVILLDYFRNSRRARLTIPKFKL